jgi:hypothetical protein
MNRDFFTIFPVNPDRFSGLIPIIPTLLCGRWLHRDDSALQIVILLVGGIQVAILGTENNESITSTNPSLSIKNHIR